MVWRDASWIRFLTSHLESGVDRGLAALLGCGVSKELETAGRLGATRHGGEKRQESHILLISHESKHAIVDKYLSHGNGQLNR